MKTSIVHGLLPPQKVLSRSGNLPEKSKTLKVCLDHVTKMVEDSSFQVCLYSFLTRSEPISGVQHEPGGHGHPSLPTACGFQPQFERSAFEASRREDQRRAGVAQLLGTNVAHRTW